MRTVVSVIKAACLILVSRPLDAAALTARRPTTTIRHPPSHRRSSSSHHSDDCAASHPSFPPPPPAATAPPVPPSPPPPPMTRTTTTTDPHTILGLSRLSPPRDFSIVQRAYRDLARKYHPDAIVGPDASSEERERANAIFARINGAYEELKAGMRGGNDDDDAENGIFEVVIMGGNFETGKRDRRVKYRSTSTSDVGGGGGAGAPNANARRRHVDDPDVVNYDRILELRKRTNLRGKNWSDPGEFEYPSGGRHNGDFGPPRRW